MKVKTDFVPSGSLNYITAGKVYDAYNVDSDSHSTGFNIVDDGGHERYCLLSGCFHLALRNWIVVEV